MGVLRFNGTSDKLRWTTLATALADVGDGAWTKATLLKRSATATFRAIGYLNSGAPGSEAIRAGMSFNGSDFVMCDYSTQPTTTPTTFTDTTSPYLLVMSKAAGNVAPRLGWKLGSGGAWTHQNLSNTIPDQITATMLEIGVWGFAFDFYSGWIGVDAWWEGAMSDSDKEALDNNWATSDIWNSSYGKPVFLCEMNVQASGLRDVAGNATELHAHGTTLDAGETLDSWNFNLSGGPIAWTTA